MKYLSLFSGIGGFELGIQQAYESLHNLRPIQQTNSKRPDSSGNTTNELQQWECVGYSEIDKYAIATYQSHFPEHHNYGDITKINEQELPDFDMLVGGFPCQAFSIAGKRKGFEDTRGTLFFDIARIIKAKQPRLVFLENVKGLLSHDNGETFRTIIATLDELGYDIQWQVLNSKNHGVPQNRERVFIVGHLGGIPERKVFPIGGDSEEDARRMGEEISYTLDANYAKGTNTLEKSRRQVVKIQQRPHGFFKGSDQEIAPSIRGASVSQNVFVNKIRRLTPIECERLQGFPDNWTIGSDTQRYKQCGNAVTVNVIRDIAERLLTTPLSDNHKEV